MAKETKQARTLSTLILAVIVLMVVGAMIFSSPEKPSKQLKNQQWRTMHQVRGNVQHIENVLQNSLIALEGSKQDIARAVRKHPGNKELVQQQQQINEQIDECAAGLRALQKPTGEFLAELDEKWVVLNQK